MTSRCRVVTAPNMACGDSFCTSSASTRSEEHTSELQSRLHLVCRLLLVTKKTRGSGTVTLNRTATGVVNLYSQKVIQSPSSSALTVGRQGANKPALQVDAYTAPCVPGLK